MSSKIPYLGSIVQIFCLEYHAGHPKYGTGSSQHKTVLAAPKLNISLAHTLMQCY